MERTRSSTALVPDTCRACQPMAPTASGAVLTKDSSHLVIGATGRLGPHLIQQLADMGAGTIVAVSRNPGEKLKKLGQQLSSSGMTLVEVAADVTDESAMAALFDRFGADLPRARGHLSGGLRRAAR